MDTKLGDVLTIKWIAESLQPFSISEDQGLIDLVSFLNRVKGVYELKGRLTVRNQFETIREGVEDMIKKKIQDESKYVTRTTDVWTSLTSSSFIALTLHYLTKDFSLQSFTLEVSPFSGNHTGENIKLFLEESLEKWGIEKNNIAIMIRDNGSNIVKAGRLMGITHAGCIGHGFHLVVGAFLSMKKGNGDSGVVNEQAIANDSNNNTIDRDADVVDYLPVNLHSDLDITFSEKTLATEVRTIVSRLKDIAKYIKNSPKAKERFLVYAKDQQQLEKDSTGPITNVLDVKTRWNSTYEMLVCLVK